MKLYWFGWDESLLALFDSLYFFHANYEQKDILILFWCCSYNNHQNRPIPAALIQIQSALTIRVYVHTIHLHIFSGHSLDNNSPRSRARKMGGERKREREKVITTQFHITQVKKTRTLVHYIFFSFFKFFYSIDLHLYRKNVQSTTQRPENKSKHVCKE